MDHPFQRWVDLARPRTQLWRTLVGIVIVVGAWMAWTVVFGLMAIGGGLSTPEALATVIGAQYSEITWLEAVMATGVTFATFWGIWLGVWLATKFLHRRELSTVFAHDRRLHLREFAAGAIIAAFYLMASIAVGLASGVVPVRTDVEIGAWLVALAPLVALLFFQTAGEELFFRGYVLQQIAAKAPHPLLWGFLPSFAFGLAHASNVQDPQFAMYYVFAATMLGLIMTAMVWRTGGLAAAMGFHLVNNIGALLLVPVEGAAPPIGPLKLEFGASLGSAPADLLVLGLLLAFVLSPLAPLPKGQPLRRK